MVRQLMRESDRFAGGEVKVSGWVRSNRSQKNFGFIALHDGTHFNTVQLVYEKDLGADFDPWPASGVRLLPHGAQWC